MYYLQRCRHMTGSDVIDWACSSTAVSGWALRWVGGVFSAVESRLDGDGGSGRAADSQEFSVTRLFSVIHQHTGQITFHRKKTQLLLSFTVNDHLLTYLIFKFWRKKNHACDLSVQSVEYCGGCWGVLTHSINYSLWEKKMNHKNTVKWVLLLSV